MTTTKKAAQTKATAAATYAPLQADCTDLLKRIATALAKHQAEQATRPTDWGYPGDLGRTQEQLALVLAGLGDRTAVNALGIKY